MFLQIQQAMDYISGFAPALAGIKKYYGQNEIRENISNL